MENSLKPTTKKSWFLILVAPYLIIECMAFLGMATSDPKSINIEIKSQVVDWLGNDHSIENVQRMQTKRIGPVTLIEMTYFSPGQKHVEAKLTQWLGFKPKLNCLTTFPNSDGC